MHGYLFLSLAHESEMRGYLVYVLIVKNLLILFKFSHVILDLTSFSRNLGGFLKTFLDGSVDHIIDRDYIVNLHSFIYCSLACPSSQSYPLPASSSFSLTKKSFHFLKKSFI